MFLPKGLIRSVSFFYPFFAAAPQLSAFGSIAGFQFYRKVYITKGAYGYNGDIGDKIEIDINDYNI